MMPKMGLKGHFWSKFNTFTFVKICSLGFSGLFGCLKRKLIFCSICDQWDIYRPKSGKIQKIHKLCSIHFSEILCNAWSIWSMFGTKLTCFIFFCVIALFFMMFLVLEPLHFLEDETFTRLQNKSYTSKL